MFLDNDILSLVRACSSYEGTFDTISDVESFAKQLDVCAIYMKIFKHGREQLDLCVYGSSTVGMQKYGHATEYTSNYDINYSFIVNIYRNSDARQLTKEDDEVFDFFRTTITNSLAIYFLSRLAHKYLNYESSTGLANRFFYFTNCEKLIKQNKLGCYTAAFINCKNMRKINRLFGSEVGDLLLALYTKSFLEILDETQGEMLAYVGGDNFVMLFLNEHFEDIFEIIKSKNLHFTYRGDDLFFNMQSRAGFARLDDASFTNANMIMDAITSAIILSKEPNYPDYVFFNHTMGKTLSEIDSLKDSITNALEKKKFAVYFQPEIDISTEGQKRLVRAEALVRWRTQEGMATPIDFIPFAEQSGQICQIDFYVLEETCQLLKHWINLGITPVPISINFSKLNFSSSNLAERIVSTIDKYNLDHSLISIEFKENTFDDKNHMLFSSISALHKEGIKTSIDGFGTTSTSILKLLDLNIDYLKIDKEMVSNATQRTITILKSLFDLTKELGIEIVSEGIEDEECLKRLQEVGCHLYQSEYFDKALSPRYFENRLKNPMY